MCGAARAERVDQLGTVAMEKLGQSRPIVLAKGDFSNAKELRESKELSQEVEAEAVQVELEVKEDREVP